MIGMRLGMCIGGPYCLGMMKADPNRVSSAVLLQSIGLDNNRDLFHDHRAGNSEGHGHA